MNINEHAEWYTSTRDRFARLGRTVELLLRELLTSRGIDFLAVESRAKTVDSFVGKLQRKSYRDPRTEVTDLCGVRIITYLETDVDQIAAVLPDVFRIDRKRSVDKSRPRDVDRFGYRSQHFICDLGWRRSKLPEYSAFAGLQFELQVRTVLQHAWAQIEHDRNYKSGGVLPEDIQRDFHLVAASLEAADREFVRIAKRINAYTLDVEGRISRGDLNIPITSTSLAKYLEHRRPELEKIEFSGGADSRLVELAIRELKDFGITTLAGLQAIVTPELLAKMEEYESLHESNEIGLVREAMLYADAERYLEHAWRNSWDGMDPGGFQLLSDRYGPAEAYALLRGYGIDFIDELGHIWKNDEFPSSGIGP